jgi:hypothetical protein
MHPEIERDAAEIVMMVEAARGDEHGGRPFLSRDWAGDMASAIGSPNLRPSGVAQVR